MNLGTWLGVVVLLAVSACGAARAQDATAGGAMTKPRMMAKDPDAGWEVVTVKPSASMETGDRIHIHGRHVALDNEAVDTMLLIGYTAQKNQIVGLPDWTKTERWNIDGVADVDGEPSLAQFQAMVRRILAERFGMTLHHEQRKMEVLALRVSRGGSKLAANTSDPNGLPDRQDSRSLGQHAITVKNTSMPELGLMLLGQVDRPLVDQTGLKGKYDFQLKWTYDDSSAPTDGSAAPGLFTALQEQLGLKLEPTKAMADVLVVDRVERPGTN